MLLLCWEETELGQGQDQTNQVGGRCTDQSERWQQCGPVVVVVVVDGEKWTDSGYLLIVEPIGFANILIMRNLRKKADKDNWDFLAWATNWKDGVSSTDVERLRIVFSVIIVLLWSGASWGILSVKYLVDIQREELTRSNNQMRKCIYREVRNYIRSSNHKGTIRVGHKVAPGRDEGGEP